MLGSYRTVGGGGQALAARAAVADAGAIGGEEPLRVARALEAAHPSLALPRRLVGMLGPVVQPLVSAVLDIREHLAPHRTAPRRRWRACP